MKSRTRRLWATVLVLPLAASPNMSKAQDVAVVGDDKVKVYQSEGHYEYNRDGIPLIGVITSQVDSKRVKFTTCSNNTLDVSLDQLRRSKARCPNKPRHPGTWTADASTIVPIFKAKSGGAMDVKFDGKMQRVTDLPAEYEKYFWRAKSGALLGYAFKGEDGQKSIVILKESAPYSPEQK